jgi:hypothetical protein
MQLLLAAVPHSLLKPVQHSIVSCCCCSCWQGLSTTPLGGKVSQQPLRLWERITPML